MRILFAVLFGAAVCHGQPYFDESAQDRVVLGNNGYEVAFSKDNGGILSIRDKAAGASLTLGSRNGCLWGVQFAFPGPNSNFQCSARFTRQGLSRFSYAWDRSSSTLTLTYADNPVAARRVNAVVTVNASATAYFDLKVTIENRWDSQAGQVLLPSELVHDANTVQAGYLPLQLPGVRVKPAYFTSRQNACCLYPGINGFADYQALDALGGHLAIFTVNPVGSIQPVSLGFGDNTAAAPGTFTTRHAFMTSVPAGSSYSSPLVRVAIGLAARDTILMYRNANGIAAYPDIADKLGDRFIAMAQSPLIKVGWPSMVRVPFTSAIAQLDTLSAPALLHPVEFEPGGFNAILPDQLPPDARWGSSDDFSAWAGAARGRGFLVMPYNNFTIWRKESPSANSLPAPMTLDDVSGKDFQNQPLISQFANFSANVVSPYHPYVRQRTDQLMALWRDAAPVDFVFWDQVGARPWLRDYNRASPDSIRYSDGWLDLWRIYAVQGLMTEDGWDRLAAAGIGFCGSPLTATQQFNWSVTKYGTGSNGNRLLGAGNWDPYPLATWLLHDKVLLYQHDLEQRLTTQTTEVIAWNLAFGNMLTYNYPFASPALVTPSGVQLGNLLQRLVAARYAGHTLDDFRYLAPEVTQSLFGDISVIANWQQTAAYVTGGGAGVVPGGYLAQAADGSIVAGSFGGSLNGAPLTAGEHDIVIQRTDRSTVVYQPMGGDTAMLVDAPLGWQTGGNLRVVAVAADGSQVKDVAFTVIDARVSFDWTRSLDGTPVDSYQIIAQ